MTDKTPLKPPDGYKTWIDYAIATMDVRTPHLESCDTDTVILSDDFRQVARDERDELVAALEDITKAIADTCTSCHAGSALEVLTVDAIDLLARAKGKPE